MSGEAPIPEDFIREFAEFLATNPNVFVKNTKDYIAFGGSDIEKGFAIRRDKVAEMFKFSQE